MILNMIIEKIMFRLGHYEVDHQVLFDIFYNLRNTEIKSYKKSPVIKNLNQKIKVGLLTNEIPPIVYGGVATWIVNFIDMFQDEENYEIIPIFLAYNDKLPECCLEKYPNIRIINDSRELKEVFSDIDVCINNLWIALNTITEIKEIFPNLNIISVCHSLIRMENITNLGSCYTNNFNQQELTFQESDCIVLISKAEEEYYNNFGYGLMETPTRVIYNSYVPKYDNNKLDVNYASNNPGYIGRHVPRKRPELVIKAVDYLNKGDITVTNMGVDYDKYDNEYWRELEKIYKDQLVIVPFSTDKNVKEDYWKNIGINCITGIYEPFGYTICESIDRRIPVIVSNIDGPKEIIEDVKEYIFTYEVDKDNYNNDIINFSSTLKKMWEIPAKEREERCEKARKCLDKIRPEVIKPDWINLINELV
tara:strand:- start:1363 stop:2622 length:1260 start_codon:yes stop_codon:yes gene_type:complete